jgi:hypothetical protein
MSPSSSTSALYARLPYGVRRKYLRAGVTYMNVSTPALRQLLKEKTLDRDIKGQLWSFLQVRRATSRRRRHGH